MASSAALKPVPRPEHYKAPKYSDVKALSVVLRRQRQRTIDRMSEIKKVRRGEWEDVVAKIPKAYRKLLLAPDLPQLRDQINRVAGLIAKQPPMVEVMPPSGKPGDVAKAAAEEARLHAIRIQVADQQDRDPYAMGIDAQVSWGESWILVYPDPRWLNDKDYERGEDEPAKEYTERYRKTMASNGVPLCIEDVDPQTVLPHFSDRERLACAIIETEHTALAIELGMGYVARRKSDDSGDVEWLSKPHTLSQGYVSGESRAGEDGGWVDVNHDRNQSGSAGADGMDRVVRKFVYIDPWVYQCYLDGALVEEWYHDLGFCNLFPAKGEQSSDRDPEWQSHGIIDPALAIAKQVVLFSAVLASNAMQHGFPTAFLKNPQHGLVHPITGEPLTRQVKLGEMNLLGPQEEIQFPYLQAEMMGDFFKYMDYLSGALEQTTLSNFGKAIGSDIAGYAIAQIRSMQLSVLAPIYQNAARQWRKIYYAIRMLVKRFFPGGISLPGAVEEDEESGAQYRPLLDYGPDDCTDFAIEVHIEEGIQQDEMAERKSNLEMLERGVWSRRRVMENTGVEDPARELEEINIDRMLNSQAADAAILQMALEINTQRRTLTRQDMSNPFTQAIEQAKQGFMGGGGQFQNQASAPANASPDGTPLNQQAQIRPSQPGGPMTGPPEGIRLDALGVPKAPGGVEGVQQAPVGAPG